MSRKSAIKFTKLFRVCTNGAPSMIDVSAGTEALLERFLDRPLLKYNCIMHQETLCGKKNYVQHSMISVVNCVNKIRPI